MLGHDLKPGFGPPGGGRPPRLLAVYCFRYDAALVPDMRANIADIVDGHVWWDDRAAAEAFSHEGTRQAALLSRAAALGASWVLAIDPDERLERGAATEIRRLIDLAPAIWSFRTREMYAPDAYRTDGIWGRKSVRRLFPVSGGMLFAGDPVHAGWPPPVPVYPVRAAKLNLYHLKMIDPAMRRARRELYTAVDPARARQAVGYDYLTDETGLRLEKIPPGREYDPPFRPGALDWAAPPAPAVATASPPARDIALAALRGRLGPGADLVETVFRDRGWTAGPVRLRVGADVRGGAELATVVIGLGAPEELAAAVDSLLAQEPGCDVIVVNSGGGDAAAALGARGDRVTLAEIPEPVFAGAARNVGAALAGAPWVAFLAGDCVARPGWVAARLARHRAGAEAVASSVVTARPDSAWAWAHHLLLFGRRLPFLPPGEATLFGVSYARALIEGAGFFDPRLRIGEDTDFNAPLSAVGRIVAGPDVQTIHGAPAGPVDAWRDLVARGRRSGRHRPAMGNRTLAPRFGRPWFALRAKVLSVWRDNARLLRLLAGLPRPDTARSYALGRLMTRVFVLAVILGHVREFPAELAARRRAHRVLRRIGAGPPALPAADLAALLADFRLRSLPARELAAALLGAGFRDAALAVIGAAEAGAPRDPDLAAFRRAVEAQPAGARSLREAAASGPARLVPAVRAG